MADSNKSLELLNFLIELIKGLNEVDGKVKYPILSFVGGLVIFFVRKGISNYFSKLKGMFKKFKSLKFNNLLIEVQDDPKEIQEEAKEKEVNPIEVEKIKFSYAVKDLSDHPLFDHIKMLRNEMSPEFQTHGKRDIMKELIYQDFISIKLQSTHDNMRRISLEYPTGLSRAKLRSHILDRFDDCNECLANNFKELLVRKQLTRKDAKSFSELECIKHAENVSNKFMEARKTTMRRYLSIVDKILGNYFNETNFQCINQLYTVILWEMDDIMEDSLITFAQMNGDFVDLEYRNG